MKITFNDEVIEIEEGINLRELLRQKKMLMGRWAVWIDEAQIAKTDYDERIIKEGEIVKVKRISSGG